ncbi:MAG: HAD family hydrolase [Deltaproteobacteria bacterium]|nr:HAD family hydrolase [Kofleriaceae bacterium]
MTARARAVTFDAGQTLVELDTAMLSRRLAERGLRVDAATLDGAQPPAWRRYEQTVKDAGHEAPWQIFMRTLLEGAGVADARAVELAAWLWDEQPAKNLWRRPIPGMFELAAELTARGVPVGILSNSEGKLAELIDEIGWRAPFRVIVDSGRLGVAKPERAIFEHAARALGVTPAEVVHVGDSRTADIDGARAVGMRAIWFGAAARERPEDGDDVAIAAEAGAVRAALVRWGVL